MKTIERFLVMVAMVVLIASCAKDKDYEPKPLNLPLKAAGIITADNTFGLDLYTKLATAAVPGTRFRGK